MNIISLGAVDAVDAAGYAALLAEIA